MGKGGSVSSKEQIAMSEDTSGNPGVARWPEFGEAFWAVRRMRCIASLGGRGFGPPVR